MNKRTNKLSLVALACSLSLTACNQETTSTLGPDYGNNNDTDTDFDQIALVSNLTDNVITPTFDEFLLQAQAQTVAVDAYCAAEKSFAAGSGDQASVDSAKSAAQQAWRDSMNVWQQAEMMQLGPLLEQDGLVRNNIYSWPIVNTCSIDYDVVYFQEGTVNGQPYNIATRTPSRKSMVAIEYLLFNNNLAHSCDAGSPPDWNSWTDSERVIARCEFATEVAQDVANNAQTLVDAWNAEDGYAQALKQAGTEASSIESAHDAVNRISDAMFYLDSKTKDGKLATPLGLFSNECGGIACPEAVEAPFSMHSYDNIQNNLIAFERLLTGDGGIGFTDYLVDVGDQDTADTMTADVATAIANVSASENSMQQDLINDEVGVQQKHAEVKAVTDKLKVDFINSLALELPSTSAGDND
ncbi:imelysin family protein [Thalassotalea agarivorans]|uniref:Predicted lipoprotein n=1 Tax=Thalassotalea agarivorans TaxID=349064 RepID=A0A1I0B4E7_THASX|nr:imelysin family protein [Thalassotalea agarivorans]SET00856.1 Predicted lipoprotein [Thalassotalea agarivorans]